jgi:hypothetical protein
MKMSDEVPRRLRRFERKKEAAPEAFPSDAQDTPIASPTERGKRKGTDELPPLRYWDQRDPSLDELSTSLFDQIESEEKAEAAAEPKRPDAAPDDQMPVPARRERGAEKTPSPPKTEKENLLDARRKRRLERDAKTGKAPSAAPSAAAKNAPAPSASAGIPADTDQSLDIGDLLDASETGEKKDASAKKENTDDLDKLVSEKDLSLEEIDKIKLDDPELEKLKKNLKKSWNP